MAQVRTLAIRLQHNLQLGSPLLLRNEKPN